MELLKKIAEKLGIKKDTDITEEDVLLALDKKPVADKIVEDVNNPLAKLVGENREIKLSNLVKAGMLTPAAKKLIAEKYVDAKAITLELAHGGTDNDAFDLLHDVLVLNRPVKLEELTGIQSVELANPGTEQPNAMQKVVAQQRVDAGLDKK